MRGTRLSACYWRWVKRLGKKKAIMALAHLMLRIAYHILLNKTPYKELGSDYLVDREKKREERLIKSLELRGYQVTKALT